ncbi:MAG TPA: hypothetical protein PLB89_13175 [Flavobacteriales bacterium]|nr:hypothetical protein [Flavobacteriales bacterium]
MNTMKRPMCLAQILLASHTLLAQRAVAPTKLLDLSSAGSTTTAVSMMSCGTANDKLCYSTFTNFGAQGSNSAIWSTTGTSAPFKLHESQATMTIVTTAGNVVYYRTGSGFTGANDFVFGATNLVQAVPVAPVAPVMTLTPTHVPTADPFDARILNGKLICAMDMGTGIGVELTSIPSLGKPKTLVKDIDPGASSGCYFDFESPSCLFGGKLYFNAHNTTAGYELWTTDGSEQGTQQFSDFTAPGLTDFRVMHQQPLGDKILLSASNELGDQELWSCTASAGSLALLKDIYPGTDHGSGPGPFTTVGNLTYFAAQDGTNGRELWVTDGTSAGTRMVKDLRTGPNQNSNPHAMVTFKNKLYFFATNNAGEVGLYRTDGTAAGTVLCHTTTAQGYIAKALCTSGRLYYLVPNTTTSLYRTDGTAASVEKVQPTTPITENYPYEQNTFVARGTTLYFMAGYTGPGSSLYKITDPAFVPPVIKK